MGVGSNIASTTIVKAPERNLWSSLFATDRSDFNEEQLRRLEFYQELAISEKQFDEGKYKEAKTALFDLKDK